MIRELKAMWNWADSQDRGIQFAMSLLFLVYGVVALLAAASAVALVVLGVMAVAQ